MSERHDVLAGMQAGADDYLIKPLDPFDVQTRLIAAERVTALHTQLADYRVRLERLNGELAEQARTDPLTQLGNRLRLREDLQIAPRPRATPRPSLQHRDVRPRPLQGLQRHLRAPARRHSPPADRRDPGRRPARRATPPTATAARSSSSSSPTNTSPTRSSPPNRLRATIEALAIPHGGNDPHGILTISVGVATYEPGRDRSTATILELADRALYTAKQRGRNQVATAHAELPIPR